MAAPKQKPRGEIAELSTTLQSLCTAGKRSDKELRQQKRDVFKKVISYMTVGMDMSSIFPSMTSCANLSPDDVVLKKMLYLYITHYASSTPDLALLAINQLLKDCIDQDPTVRGLALRSLCSLRLGNLLEYVTSPVLAGLDDRHPYVRRTAVMGVLKIHHIDPNVVANMGLVERLSELLSREGDAQVLANLVTVIGQIDPSLLAGKAILYNLLNRMKEFSEWAQVTVLQLVSGYTPSSEQEVYDILNTLEERLGAANSAVVLATMKTFLHLTLQMPATHQQVLERIKDPLKSLIGREDPAVVYPVLLHVLLLVQRAPVIFEADYLAFYCRTHEPWYIKCAKMEILSTLASSTNCYEIVNELTEYARDVVYPGIAREAVKAVGRIALNVPEVPGIVERLLVFLESNCEEVMAEALVQMKDLLRRYPDMAEVVVAQIMLAISSSTGEHLTPLAVSEPEARAALIWIIGQFGQHIPDAPYLLEPLADSFAAEDVRVRLALLTAGGQLFFKRPPETQALLGRLLSAGVADTHQDVHDRALLYYRLLRANVAEAERIINPPLLAVASFSEATTQEMRDTIFSEFNSLSVIYQAPASTFLDQGKPYYSSEDLEEQDSPAAAAHDQAATVDNSTLLLADVDDVGAAAPAGVSVGGGAQPPASSPDLMSGLDSLHVPMPGSNGVEAGGGLSYGLDLGSLLSAPAPADASSLLQPSPLETQLGVSSLLPPPSTQGGGSDLLSLGSPYSAPSAGARSAAGQEQRMAVNPGSGLDDFLSFAAPAPAASTPTAPSLSLLPQARLSPAVFQDKWKSLPAGHTSTQTLSPATVSAMAANNHKDFCSFMKQAYIQTMASGGAPPTYKYYFYGQDTSGAVLLAELVVNTLTSQSTVTLKADNPALLPQFTELWSTCMLGFAQ